LRVGIDFKLSDFGGEEWGLGRSYMMRKGTKNQKLHYTAKLLKVIGLGLGVDKEILLLENTMWDLLEEVRSYMEGDEEYALKMGSMIREIGGEGDMEELYDMLYEDMDFKISGKVKDEGIRREMGMAEHVEMREISEEQGLKAYSELTRLLQQHPRRTLESIRKRMITRKLVRNWRKRKSRAERKIHNYSRRQKGPVMS